LQVSRKIYQGLLSLRLSVKGWANGVHTAHLRGFELSIDRDEISEGPSLRPNPVNQVQNKRLLRLEEQDCAVTQVEVDEVLRLCSSVSAILVE
jgi:hypothetical protein